MNAIRLSFVLLILSWAESSAVKRHNILWFVVDDMSANFSCYGEKLIETPNVDRMARNGVLFTQAYATSPVCSTFRSALITGMYQNSIGAHHHRSGRGEHRVRLPDGVSPIPELFQKAGYFTCIGSGLKGYDFRSLPTTTQKRGRPITISIGEATCMTVTIGREGRTINLSSCRFSSMAESCGGFRKWISRLGIAS